ncbi:MAG TPA: acylneuraminate cytidylyltransferase family protein [Candidatus Paceibacterota bacterium]
MNSSQEVWAIIPTRGGSIGLPEKNIRILAGKPLLHYMLEAATQARRLTRVVLTTDSDNIEREARIINGVEVRRHDPLLSAPGQPTFGTFRRTLEDLVRESGMEPMVVVMLRVTTPLCLSSDIENTVGLLLENRIGAISVLSVTKSDVHPKRTYVMDERCQLTSREETPEKDYPLPRQVFDDVYIRNGAIYATFPYVVQAGRLWGAKPLAYVMPKERSININDEVDFVLAEALLRY